MDSKFRMQTTIEDFRMLYQLMPGIIETTKQRQWTITYYLLLLHAAIIGFCKTVKIDSSCNNLPFEKVVLTVLAFLIIAFGVYRLLEFQFTLARYRKRSLDALSYLSKNFQISEKNGHEVQYGKEWDKRYPSNWNGFWNFTAYLIILLCIGALFVVYYLYGIQGDLRFLLCFPASFIIIAVIGHIYNCKKQKRKI